MSVWNERLSEVVKNKISYIQGQFILNLEYFKFPWKQNIQKLKADVLKLMLWKSPTRLNPLLGNPLLLAPKLHLPIFFAVWILTTTTFPEQTYILLQSPNTLVITLAVLNRLQIIISLPSQSSVTALSYTHTHTHTLLNLIPRNLTCKPVPQFTTRFTFAKVNRKIKSNILAPSYVPLF